MRRTAAGLVTIVALFAVTLTGAKPKEHSSHSNDKAHYEKAHVDQGRHLALGHDKLHKFNTRDRDAAEVWLQRRSSPPAGFRQSDLLPSALVPRLQIGSVLDNDLLRRSRKLPSDLLAVLPAPPSGLRYRSINGDIGLLDSADRLHDMLHLPRLPRPPGL